MEELYPCAGYMAHPPGFGRVCAGARSDAFPDPAPQRYTMTETAIMHHGKVACPYATGLIFQECCPGLARNVRFPVFWHVFLNGSFAHPHPQLQQFTSDPLGSPQAILPGQLVDPLDRFCRNIFLSLRLLPPRETKQFPMTAQQGVWLNNMQRLFSESGEVSQRNEP